MTNPARETTRYAADAREKNRLKFHSMMGIPIPKDKKAAHRLRAIVRKIDKRDK